MSLNNSLITKLRESSLTVNEQSCLRGQRVYGWEVRLGAEPVLKIVDAGYCLYVHIFMKNIKSLKTFNFNNSNQLMPDLRHKHKL